MVGTACPLPCPATYGVLTTAIIVRWPLRMNLLASQGSEYVRGGASSVVASRLLAEEVE
jgi:hypothetical protein